jgi:hypothetical protein
MAGLSLRDPLIFDLEVQIGLFEKKILTYRRRSAWKVYRSKAMARALCSLTAG